MTNKLILFGVFAVILLSCKTDKYPYGENNKALCEVLEKMYKNDQKYRLLIQDPIFEVLDSIRSAEGIQETYIDLPKETKLAYGKKARLIADKKYKKFSKSEEDSIMRLQIDIDNINTEKLIEITQEVGWPTKNNIGCDEYFSPGMIFRHSQYPYHNKIKILIDEAYKEGQMEKAEYIFILNHVNGREDFEVTKEKTLQFTIE